MTKHEIIVNGGCAVCGRPLTGNRIYVCEECQRKAKAGDVNEDGKEDEE